MKGIWKVSLCLLVAVMFVVPLSATTIGNSRNRETEEGYNSNYMEEERKLGVGQAGSTILILVNESIYPEIEESLSVYKEDVRADGYQLLEEQINSQATPPEIRELLQSYHNEYNIEGAVLVGDIPAAYAEIHTGEGTPNALHIWISLDAFDMYYMDLDGQWDHVENPDFCADAPGKVVECTMYESCEAFKDEYVVYMGEEEREWDYSFPQGYEYITNKGQYRAEIWVARIMAHNLDISGKSEADIINKFFERSHNYKAGVYEVSDAAYLCDAISDPVEDHDMDFSNIFSTVMRKPHITEGEYRALLESPEGSKLVYLGAHSAPQVHSLYRGRLTVEELLHLNKKSVFYMLNACSACRWDQYVLEPGNPNYLGGIYTFDISDEEKTNNGLAAIGFTGVGGFNLLHYFTSYLNSHSDANYGTAWKYYFNRNLMSIFQPWNYVFLGDPTIGPKPTNNVPNTPNKPTGTSSGKIGEEYTYTSSTVDIDGDKIRYGWDWDGDKSVDEWSNLVEEGQTVEMTHSWDEEGSYQIRVKAKDEHGAESEWSEPLTVSMPKVLERPLLSFLEQITNWVKETIWSG